MFVMRSNPHKSNPCESRVLRVCKWKKFAFVFDFSFSLLWLSLHLHTATPQISAQHRHCRAPSALPPHDLPPRDLLPHSHCRITSRRHLQLYCLCDAWHQCTTRLRDSEREWEHSIAELWKRKEREKREIEDKLLKGGGFWEKKFNLSAKDWHQLEALKICKLLFLKLYFLFKLITNSKRLACMITKFSLFSVTPLILIVLTSLFEFRFW